MSLSGKIPERENRRIGELIVALLENPSIPAAASKIGISLATGKRWMQGQTFIREYREARQALVTGAIGRLAQLTGESLITLNRVMMHSTNDSARVSAARSVLSLAFEGNLQADIDQRITELEKADGLRRGPVRVA